MILKFDLVQLQYFQAIARAGSLSAAARAIHVTQPTLSTALRQLETRLGTKLMDRGRDGIELTSTGREFLHHANELLLAAERAEQIVRRLEVEEIGDFTIACPESLGGYFLPSLLAHLFRVAPRLGISSVNGTSRQVERAVLSREAHFGLVAMMIPHPEFVKQTLFWDVTELIALAPCSRRLSDAKMRLQREPLIYVDGLPQEPELLRKLSDIGLTSARLVGCGTTGLVKSMALAGLGVAVLPRRVAMAESHGRLATLHTALPSIRDELSLIHHADLHRTKAALRLKDELIAQGKRFAQATHK
jgi:DNA-binding transcriptional LysR family regulator